MKRRGSIALCVLMLSAICALGLAACETETGQPEHIHTFSQEWTYSDTHHWHVAICGHEDEVSDYAEHTFQSGACTVCACPQPSTQGLEYTLINGDTAYEVSGIGMEKERNIVIPDTYHGLPVISVGVGAFSGCSSLTSVTIGSGVTSIGIGAFSGCSGLTEIVIPDSVASIGNNAFFGCSSLTNVTIGNGVTSIGKHVFSDCSGLENIAVKDENTVYCSAGKCLIEKATKMLLLGCKNSVIPSDGSVTSIGEGAFA